MYKRIVHLSVVASLLVGLATAFSSPLPADDAQQTPNAFCPVMTDEPIDPEIWVDYNGRRVYLCCKRCRRDFLEEPEKYLAALPADFFAAAEAAASEPIVAEENAESSKVATPHEGDHHHDEEQISEVQDVAESSRTPHADAETHDHQSHHSTSASLVTRSLKFSGRFHPVAIHFPIALVFAAFLAELMTLSGASRFRDIARFCIAIAAAGGILAALLGWAAAWNANYPALNDVLFRHRWLGVGAALSILAAAVASELAVRRTDGRLLLLYRILLLLAVTITCLAAHHGGILIYGPDHFQFPGS